MPDSYSQISMQLVFAVKHREAVILPQFKDKLVRYIIGIIKGNKQKPLAVNAVADHIHIFFGMDHTLYIPDFVRDLKSDSSLWVNENRFSPKQFHWQTGNGIFSYCRWHRPVICRYIENQEQHHQKQTFRQEYLKMLKEQQVDYKPEYLFEFFE